MTKSESRRRQMLLARAERTHEGLSRKFVEPLSKELENLQAALRALSEAVPDDSGVTVEGSRAVDDHAAGAASRNPVVFIHIPKTAGTTVTFWLKLLHGDRHVKAPSYTNEPATESLAAKLRARSVESVAGHLPYSARAVLPADASFFTFLREPIERALSHFCYFRERESNPGVSAAGEEIGQAAALEAALATWEPASTDSQAVLPDNLQTRMLSGFDMTAPCSREMFDAAARNIGRFDVVGLTERFDESTVLLARTYGWELLALQSHRVRTQQRLRVDALEPRVLAGLRRLNALDEELYAEGMRRFEAAVGRVDATFARDVEALRLARWLETERASREPVPADGEIQARATEILAATAAAFDENPPMKAEKLLESLASSTKQLHAAVGDRLAQATTLARQFREVMSRVP